MRRHACPGRCNVILGQPNLYTGAACALHNWFAVASLNLSEQDLNVISTPRCTLSGQILKICLFSRRNVPLECCIFLAGNRRRGCLSVTATPYPRLPPLVPDVEGTRNTWLGQGWQGATHACPVTNTPVLTPPPPVSIEVAQRAANRAKCLHPLAQQATVKQTCSEANLTHCAPPPPVRYASASFPDPHAIFVHKMPMFEGNALVAFTISLSAGLSTMLGATVLLLPKDFRNRSVPLPSALCGGGGGGNNTNKTTCNTPNTLTAVVEGA